MASYTVDKSGNGNFTTIQAAIDAADSGDTINIAAGTYNENLNIIDGKTDLKINGAGDTTNIVGSATVQGAGTSFNSVEFSPSAAVDAADQGTPLLVLASDVHVTNSTFAGTGADKLNSVRPFIVSGSGAGFTLSDSTITGWSDGGYLNPLAGGGSGSISGNTFDENGTHLNVNDAGYVLSGNSFTNVQNGGAPIAIGVEGDTRTLDISKIVLANNTIDEPNVRDISIYPSFGNLTVTGSGFAERLRGVDVPGDGTTRNFTFNAGGGNDTLFSSASDDLLNGGTGSDVLEGTAGNLDGDTLVLGDFNDIITVDDASNLKATLVNNQVLIDSNGDGNTDAAVLLQGGAGATIVVSGDDITFNGPVTPTPPTEPTTGNDSQSGTGASDTANLLGGNDTYRAGGGNDDVDGGAGNDRVYGDAGNDTVAGGAGNDYARGGDGNDDLSGGVGNDRVYGDAGRDSVEGGAGNDYARGGDDNDTVNGGVGNDRVYGDGGRDLLDGGVGNDYLVGGDGPDILTGGRGNDILIGGAGADRYVFTPDRGAVDLIRGFSTAEGDRIDLGGQDYTSRTAGDGDVILTLSGGSQVRLDGVTAQEFGDGKGFFVG